MERKSIGIKVLGKRYQDNYTFPLLFKAFMIGACRISKFEKRWFEIHYIFTIRMIFGENKQSFHDLMTILKQSQEG